MHTTDNRSFRVKLVALLAVAALGLAALIWIAADGPEPTVDTAARNGQAALPESGAAPTPFTAGARSSLGQTGDSIEREASPDPRGSLRLEGQVIDEYEAPVAGAVVILDSRPPRIAKSSEDGSFAFENLLPMTYRVRARKEDLAGGPIVRELTDESAPVVIRMAEGGRLAVEVVERDGGPIQGAEVTSDREHVETTDDKGIATLRGATGQMRIWVRAPKYATASTLVTLPNSPGAREYVRVEMIAGAPLVGRVVNERGQPVAGARVVSTNPLELFDQSHIADAVPTDENGYFKYEVVPAGTYQFRALHGEYAPGTSEPVRADGTTPVSDVEIVLAAGGEIAGRVVDADGASVAGATVKVQVHPPSAKPLPGDWRQAVSDEDGNFSLSGLAPRGHLLVAETRDATSDAMRVDLHAKTRARGLTVRLNPAELIAGQVVDSEGEPVADIKVVAVPEEVADVEIRDVVTSVTEGDGSFVLKPLSQGTYRVGVEKRPGELRSDHMVVTGTKDLYLTILGDGAVAGTVQLENGSEPDFFTVAIGAGASTPFQGDGFLVSEVAPGRYDVTIRGPGFADTVVPDVEITPSKTKQLGTITVRRGRQLTGRVVDANGGPVVGAFVVAGKQLLGDGGSISAAALDQSAVEHLGMRGTTTDDRGNFRISGLGTERLVLAAEHPEKGRSHAVRIPASPESGNYELILQPYGSVRGVVLSGTAPAAGIRVQASSEGAHRQYATVVTDDRGHFQFDQLPAGPHSITAVDARAESSNVVNENVTVVAGETEQVEIQIGGGEITLSVHVRGQGGLSLDSAEVFLFEGEVHASTIGELNRAILGNAGGRKLATATATTPAVLRGVAAGASTICVVPFNHGSLAAEQINERLSQIEDSVPVHCQTQELPAAPKEQSVTLSGPVTSLASN